MILQSEKIYITAENGRIDMKKILMAICLSAAAFGFGKAEAKTPADMKINGQLVNTGANVLIYNDRAMVPVRKTAEILGADSVEWNENSRSVTLKSGGNTVKAQIGSDSASVNGKTQTMPCAAQLCDGKTFISAKFLGEAMGAEVKWNEKTHTVEITKDGITVNRQDIETAYTGEDLEWLAKIVNSEAGGEIHDGKIAVANVIMNRIESSEFPDSVYDVVFDKKYGVQFTPVSNGTIYNDPSVESYHAAKQALFGANTAGQSLYFCNPKTSTSLWIVNNRQFFKSIGNHDFYI